MVDSKSAPLGYGSVPPALTGEEWQVLPEHPNRIGLADMPGDEAKAIALLNATLSDTDRRKLNWDYVDRLRQIGQRLMGPVDYPSFVPGGVEPATGPGRDKDPGALLRDTADGAALLAIADILASYLPPRDGEQNG